MNWMYRMKIRGGLLRTGLFATSPANAPSQPTSGFPLLSLAERAIATKFTTTLLILCFAFAAQAQDFKKQFRKAKELFNQANYSAAMDAFNPLMVYDKNNSYAEYATFYYALSAQRLGFSTVAKNQFAHLRKTYPTWPQLNEATLWLSKLYFESGDYFIAMKLANEITDPSMKEKLDSIKRVHLSKIKDVEIAKMLREENPNDPEVDRALVTAIGQSPSRDLDLNLFQSILQKYYWNEADFISTAPGQTIFRERYRVAALLPFRASTLEPSPERKKNQPILDIYQGMHLASDSLEKSGIHIDLLAYDTERNPEVTKALLEQDELKSVDLIIGPLFAEDAKPVQQFARENQINVVVNPVSNNSDFLADNPYSFLYQPSHETIGRKSAELVARNVSNKKTLVYYGESPKDSVMAFNYIKKALELGLKVVYAEEVRLETSFRILDKLAKATKYDEWKNPLEFTMKKDSIGSIFVASDDPVIYTKVVNSVETRGDSILVIGTEAWLEENSADYSKLEKTKVVFAAPNFCSPISAPAIYFRDAYLKRHGVLPSDNARKGFEMMMNLGKALGTYGTNFPYSLQNGASIPGFLTSGFGLQPTRDNGNFSFVTFKMGELVEVR